jgi:DNA-binding CsgD family transcriptional regulator
VPDRDHRNVLRVAVRIEEPDLRGDILDRLDGRAGLRVVDGIDEADVVLADDCDVSGQSDGVASGFDPPTVTLVFGRSLRAAPTGSLVYADASGPLLEALLRVTAEGYEARPDGFDLDGATQGAEGIAGDPDDPDGRTHPLLTPREREVLALLAEGAPNKVIARQLGISPSTAKFHVASLLDKFGARSRLDAVAIGARRGLVLL